MILILEMLMAMFIIIMMRTTMVMVVVAILTRNIQDDYYVDDGASNGDSDYGYHLSAPSITIATLARRPTHARGLQNPMRNSNAAHAHDSERNYDNNYENYDDSDYDNDSVYAFDHE